MHIPSTAAVYPDLPLRKETFYFRFNEGTGILTSDVNATAASGDCFGPTEGSRSLSMNIQGAPVDESRPHCDFVLPGKLPGTYYLAVDGGTTPKPMTVSFEAVQTINHYLSIQVEVWAGKERIGGFIQVRNPHLAAVIDTRFSGSFRPELHALEKEDPFFVRLAVIGATNNLSISNGRLDFLFYETDPWAGTLYREGLNVYQIDPLMVSSGAQPSLGAAWPLLLVPAVLPRARKRGAAFLSILIVAGSVAGCVGDGGSTRGIAPASTSNGPISSETVTRQDNKTLLESERGALVGVIRDGDRNGLPLPGKRVELLNLSSTKTNGSGRFEFWGIVPFTYVLEIDVGSEFGPVIRRNVTIEAGKILELNLTVSRPGEKAGGNVTHDHDEWPASGIEIVAQGKVELGSEFYTAPAVSDVVPEAGPASEIWTCQFLPVFPVGGVGFTCPTRPLNLNAEGPPPRIKPGAREIEIFLDWDDDAPQAVPEIGLTARLADPLVKPNDWVTWAFLPRPAKTPFRIPLMPQEADLGHQKATKWGFEVYYGLGQTPYWTTAGVYLGPPIYEGRTVTAEVLARKGNVPLEPFHPDFWGRNTSIRLLSGPMAGQKMPHVPEGTVRLNGTFSWAHYQYSEEELFNNAVTGSTTPVLEYKSPITDWKPVPTAVQSNVQERGFSFQIPVSADEVDGYYSVPQWQWRWACYDDTVAGCYAATRATYSLELWAHRGPGES